MGVKKGQKPKKLKRHEVGTVLPGVVVGICGEVIARRSEDEVSESVARDVEQLMKLNKVQDQVKVVSSWGMNVFARSKIDDKCRDETSVWHYVVKLMVSFLFHYELAHLQKGIIGVFATSAKPATLQYAHELFGKLCKEWCDAHWEALSKAKEATVTSVDTRAALTRCALKVVCDVDCMLDHPKPVFLPATASCFRHLLSLMIHCANIAVADTVGTTDDTTLCSGMEDMKYFTRITLYLMQKYKEETRLEVSKAAQGEASPILSIADTCQRILLSDVFAKDCLSTAGLITSILLQCVFKKGEEHVTVSSWLSKCFAAVSPAEEALGGKELAEGLLGKDSAKFNFLYSKLSEFSKLVVLRGIVNCGEDVMYLTPIDGCCFLYKEVIPFAEPLCTSSDPPLRYLGLQTIELVVRKIRDCIRDESTAVQKAQDEDAPVPQLLVVYDTTLADVLGRVLDVLWSVWDEPTAAIGHLLTDIFNMSLGIHKEALALHKEAGLADTGCGLNLEDISRRLVDAHWLRRGKYPSLTVMLPVVGVMKLRSMCPQLILRILEVLHIKALAHGAGALFAAYALALREELSVEEWNTEVLRPTAEALISGSEASGSMNAETVSTLLRHNVSNYALQPLLTANASVLDDVLSILADAAAKQPNDPSVASRHLASHVYIIKLAKAKPTELVKQAVTSTDPVVRINSVQLLSLGYRPSDLPTLEEITVLKLFTIRNLKTVDSAFRSQHSELLRKWLSRCKESLHRFGKDAADLAKRGGEMEPAMAARRTATEEYLIWLARYLVRSSYATSPLERRCVAMELLQFLHVTFNTVPPSVAPCAALTYQRTAAETLPRNFVSVLMGSLCESWDKVRVATWKLLQLVPSPLPGYSTEQEVAVLASKASEEMKSFKIKDADSGALVWRLLHRKYSVQLGWTVTLDDNGDAVVNSTVDTKLEWAKHAEALQSLLDRLHGLKRDRKKGEFNPTHGILAAIKNLLADANLKTMVEVDKQGDTKLKAGVEQGVWKKLICELLSCVQTICSDAMRNVAGATTGDVDEFSPIGVDCRGHAFYADRHDDAGDRLVVVNSWLAVKEGCGLIAEIITSTPLSGAGSPAELLPAENIASAGEFLMSMGLQSKHNGAIAKATEALGMVCHRTIRCRLPSLFSLPSKWLNSLLTDGGVQSDKASRILRRSAGLPHVLVAILDAEDHSAGAPLAMHAVTTLLSVVEQEEVPTDGDQPSYLHRVNALNVLKYIADDTFMRDVILGFGARCLTLTLNGFNHEVWAVRNSSLMLYSSLMQRVIGGGKVGAGSLSFKDFLIKYAEALPTLMDYLNQACDATQDKELHPCLFPLLLLFSLLAPSTDVQTAALQTKYFETGVATSSDIQVLSLVDKSHGLKNCMGRMMAARALVPLVTTTAIPTAVRVLCERLPAKDGEILNNKLHGRLLQLQQFLVVATDYEKEERVRVHMAAIQGILKSGILTALPDMHHIAPFNAALLFKACRTLMWEGAAGEECFMEFVTNCREAAGSIAKRNAVHDIGSDEMRYRVAGVYLHGCKVTEQPDEAVQFLLTTVLKSERNLLAETLKEVHKTWLQRKDVRAGLLEKLDNLVNETLAVPDKAYNIQYADNMKSVLEAVAVTCEGTPAGLAETLTKKKLVDKLWETKRKINNQAVIQPILHCQAEFTAADLSTANVETLCSELYKASYCEEAVEVRMGCVNALKGLNFQKLYETRNKSSVIPILLINLTRVICILLNDEHDGVRDMMAKLVSESPRYGITLPGLAHNEKACEMCFNWMGDIACETKDAGLAALQHLSSIILHPKTPGQSSILYEGVAVERECDVVLQYAPQVIAGKRNVVFEVENHNYYAEDLVTVMLAVKEVRRILEKWGSDEEVMKFMRKFASRTLSEARTVASVVTTTSGESRSLAFSSIYRLKIAALLCLPHADAAEVFPLIPEHQTDSMWLGALPNPPAVPKNSEWEELLFLVP